MSLAVLAFSVPNAANSCIVSQTQNIATLRPDAWYLTDSHPFNIIMVR